MTTFNQPYHQGQLDYFCAVYALINALRLTHGINLSQSRGILNGALREISGHTLLWRSLLLNHTDSYWLVDYLLGYFCREGALALRVGRLPARPRPALSPGLRQPEPVPLSALSGDALYRPEAAFGYVEAASAHTPVRTWSISDLRDLLSFWLPGAGFFKSMHKDKPQGRALILRFHRFLPFDLTPVISHWSTARDISRNVLRLYDSTASRRAVHRLPLTECALYPEDLNNNHLLGLEPESMYFLERA